MLSSLYVDKDLYNQDIYFHLSDFSKVFYIDEISQIMNDINDGIIHINNIIYISDNLENLLYAISKGICSIGFDSTSTLFNPLIKNVVLDLSSLTSIYLNTILSHHNNVAAIIYEDENIIIRELSIADFDIIYDMFKSDNLDASFFLSSYMTQNYEVEREKFISYINNQYLFYGYGQYCVLSKSNNIIIGQCGFYEDELGNISLSYYIAPSYRDMGIAYKVCKILLEFIVDEIGIDSIYAHINKDNIPSIKLINKLNFVAKNSDTYIYNINK